LSDGTAAADTSAATYRTWEKAAFVAYNAGDRQGFLDNMQHAYSARPDHPRLIYNLAVANVLNGNNDRATALVSELAAMKLSFPVTQDEDFAPLLTEPAFMAAARQLAANGDPQGHPELAFSVSCKGLVAEGIAYDPRTGDFYLGSIAKREIWRVDADGKAGVFIGSAAGLWSVFGMSVDTAHRKLWVATAAHDQMPGLKPDEAGKSAILAFDLDNKKLLHRWDIAGPEPHLVGDLTISSGGDVFATDSVAHSIYTISSDDGKLERLISDDRFSSLQGIALSDDGRYAFVSDYSGGISRIELSSTSIVTFPSPPATTTLGIDGLYMAGNALIGVQNGVGPQRIVRLALSPTLDRINDVEVLAAAAPEFNDLTLGVPVDGKFYFIANSQWNLLGPHGAFTHPERLQNLNIMRVSL